MKNELRKNANICNIYQIRVIKNIFRLKTLSGSKQIASNRSGDPDGPIGSNMHLAISGNTMSLYVIPFVESMVIGTVVSWKYVNEYLGMIMFNITMFRIYFEKRYALVLIKNSSSFHLFSYSKTKVQFAWLTMERMDRILQKTYPRTWYFITWFDWRSQRNEANGVIFKDQSVRNVLSDKIDIEIYLKIPTG